MNLIMFFSKNPNNEKFTESTCVLRQISFTMVCKKITLAFWQRRLVILLHLTAEHIPNASTLILTKDFSQQENISEIELPKARPNLIIRKPIKEPSFNLTSKRNHSSHPSDQFGIKVSLLSVSPNDQLF